MWWCPPCQVHPLLFACQVSKRSCIDQQAPEFWICALRVSKKPGSAVACPHYTQFSAPAGLMHSTCAGYGFSSSPTQQGFGVSEIAKTFNELMLKLGYDTYVAQGRHLSCLPSSSLAHCMHCTPGWGHTRHPWLCAAPLHQPCMSCSHPFPH